jgi:hypothetical protein
MRGRTSVLPRRFKQSTVKNAAFGAAGRFDEYQGRCHENGIWPRTIWKSQVGLRPRWRLAKSGTPLLGRRGVCGGM